MKNTVPGRKEIHQELVDMLNVHLANYYSLGIRLQYFHWNVEGPHFFSAHQLFEKLYKDTAEEVDVIAERIRALGEYAPGSLKEFYELSQITDRPQPIDSNAMYEDLITCFVVVREFTKEALKIADLSADESSVDMLTQELRWLEKAIWMFRSSRESASRTDTDSVVSIEKRMQKSVVSQPNHHH